MHVCIQTRKGLNTFPASPVNDTRLLDSELNSLSTEAAIMTQQIFIHSPHILYIGSSAWVVLEVLITVMGGDAYTVYWQQCMGSSGGSHHSNGGRCIYCILVAVHG